MTLSTLKVRHECSNRPIRPSLADEHEWGTVANPSSSDRREHEPRYRVGMVSRLTGVSTHTLRMWEKRYSAVVPRRTEAGGRLYADDDVARLRMLKQLTDEGHAIGSVARLTDDALHELLQKASPDAETSQIPGELTNRFLDAVCRFDIDRAEDLLTRSAVVLSPRALVHELLEPMVQEISRRWAAGDMRIAQEHAASSLLRNLLGSLMRTFRVRSDPRTVVVTTPDGDYHELGALMAAMLAAMHGWRVAYLGPSLPIDEIVFAVTEAKAQMLLLSCVTRNDVLEARLKELETTLPDGIEILAGGRAADGLSLPRARITSDFDTLERLLRR